MIRHFLDLNRLSSAEIRRLLDRAADLKAARKGRPRGALDEPPRLEGRMLALLMQRPSTRTRLSFETAMRQGGGATIVASAADSQMRRGESVADTAAVMARYADVIVMRVADHRELLAVADVADVPIVNGLSDRGHPCQALADVMTLEERFGVLSADDPPVVCWCGDANNVAVSWMHLAAALPMRLRLACPDDPLYAPDPDVVADARERGADIDVLADPRRAAEGAKCVLTDVWASMGQEDDARERRRALEPYRVDAELMRRAASDAIFMHCLPAHRGEEVADDVIDGPASAVWDEAENRVHAQKAILLRCLEIDD